MGANSVGNPRRLPRPGKMNCKVTNLAVWVRLLFQTLGVSGGPKKIGAKKKVAGGTDPKKKPGLGVP